MLIVGDARLVTDKEPFTPRAGSLLMIKTGFGVGTGFDTGLGTGVGLGTGAAGVLSGAGLLTGKDGTGETGRDEGGEGEVGREGDVIPAPTACGGGSTG